MVSLYEVASKFTLLRSRSKNQYYGLCPFHDEDTPSFHINTDLNVFYCFGCKRGGNVYQFVSYIESIPLEEVNNVLVEKYGYKELLNNTRYRKENNSLENFYSLLKQYSDDDFTKKYNFERLGVYIDYPAHYIPFDKTSALLENIKNEDFQNFLTNLGIINRHANGDYKFSFGGRLIFPIFFNKKLVGFVGRSTGERLPKYLFNRFPKKEYLMFYDEAYYLAFKEKIDYVFVVEGVYDALALLSRNIPAVSILGTNLSIEQINLLNKFGSVRFLMDQDEPGLLSYADFAKTIISSNRASFNPVFGFHTYQKDIDEVLKIQSLDDFLNNIKYKNIYDFYINHHLKSIQKQFPKNTSIDILREELIKKVFKYLKMYKNNSHAYNLMIRVCERSKYQIGYLVKRVELSLAKESNVASYEILKDIDYISPKERRLLKALVYLLKNDPNNAKDIKNIKEYKFNSKSAKIILEYILGETDTLDEKSYSLLLEIQPEKYDLEKLLAGETNINSIIANRLGIKPVKAIENTEDEETIEETADDSEYIV
jgi:DNA primase catalytic core